MPLRYFIPDWDDRVDPQFHFDTDTHTPGRDPYRDDVYAHELYPTAPYDGILLSLATLDSNKRKQAAIEAAGSVHRYLRLPEDGQHVILGDCGAFTYWEDEVPPYTTEQVLEMYQTLRFDLGVSVDHLIFAELEAEKERRWELTIENARSFLHLHTTGGYTFTPIGVVQGWDVDSYRRGTRALMQMGYRYIAVGGLVRSSVNDILQILAAVQEELHPHTHVHLFGVTRPEHAATFARLGVTSFDSTSRLRRAWMDGRQNYFLGDTSYTAIRVPSMKTVAKKSGRPEAEVRTLEQQTLQHIRSYAQYSCDIETVLSSLEQYSVLHNPLPEKTKHAYHRTLADRPWERCPCAICTEIGIEVIIFRGNNRNRRRGFHNTWDLYQYLTNLTHEHVLNIEA